MQEASPIAPLEGPGRGAKGPEPAPRAAPTRVAAVATTGYRGLLVDYGGVLTTNIWESFDRFCAGEGLEPGSVRELFRQGGDGLALLRSLERGAIEDTAFERDFGALLGVPPEGLINRLFAGLQPEPVMIAAVETIRDAGFRTGLITNSWGTGIYDRAPLEIFDERVISGDVGLHKPQAEIYLLGAERIGVDPQACVFVDDLRENVAGAEAVGMEAILHRDPAATSERLSQLFGVPIEA